MEKNKTLISILNFNGSQDTVSCLKSFYKYEEKDKYCVVVWDNDSKESEKEYLKEKVSRFPLKVHICTSEKYPKLNLQSFDLVIVYSDDNLGFAKGNNRVIKPYLNKFKYIVLLNNDTEFVDRTSSKLLDFLDEHPKVGVATTAIYYFYNKERIWNAGGKAFFGTRKYYTEKYVNQKLKRGEIEKEVDYITGCYFAVRSSLLEQYGGLTEKFFFGEEDYELCKRLKRNKVKLMVLLNEKIYHKVGASINRKISEEDKIRRAFIHHLNRFIDMKTFYKTFYWDFWRFVSSLYIFFLIFNISGKKFNKTLNYLQLLNYYAKTRTDVTQEFFREVLDGGII